MAYIKARRGVSPRQTKLILLIFMLAVGVPVGAWASGSWLDAGLSVEFAVVGLIVGALVVQRIARSLMRKALTERGQAYEQRLTFRLAPEGIVYDLTDLTMTARWSTTALSTKDRAKRPTCLASVFPKPSIASLTTGAAIAAAVRASGGGGIAIT
ncbi:hypothetical protein [Sphingomonas oryzagri]|uniref:Uncharacterized protein n=1 Tax=Sphingomonas oryzagri TaxID=3042314 RepID=A0ABT6N5Z2_9SPHN|nr:hypothetical protein [Sphingomonas oryzagri]MDH7640522.1 hypothetical protein [Sphingomonas oryzagri]